MSQRRGDEQLTRARSSVRWLAGMAPIAGLTLVLAACGGGGSKTSTAAQPATAPAPTSTATSGPTVVEIANPKLGKILANANDMVLYTYTADKGGKSACSAACLTFWPPLLVPSGAAQATAGAGVSGLGTVSEPEGTQVTYHGMPLYTYIGDKGPNQTTGQGVVDSGGTWFVVSLSPPATAPPATTAPATTPPATTPPATAPPATAPPATAPPATVAPTTAAPMMITPAPAPPPRVTPRTTPATAAPTTAPRPSPPTTATPTTTPGGGGVSY